jgi:hypothetical protein
MVSPAKWTPRTSMFWSAKPGTLSAKARLLQSALLRQSGSYLRGWFVLGAMTPDFPMRAALQNVAHCR